MRFNLFLLLTFLPFFLSWTQPITGEAKKLEFKKDRIVYTGNVKLTRGESVLKADKVVIFLNEEGKPVKMVATGNVRYYEPKRKAFSSYAEYDLKRDLIVLKGKAKVEEEQNLLEADEIVYDRKNGTLKAKGDKSKVRTIYIEEEKE